MAPLPKPLPLLPRHLAAATRSFIDSRTSSASTRFFPSGCNVITALNPLPELWLGGTFELPSRRRPGQGDKLHPSWWTSHHHAVPGLFTMIGRHRVARRLINVYWGTTLNCIPPTIRLLKSLCGMPLLHRPSTCSRRICRPRVITDFISTDGTDGSRSPHAPTIEVGINC